jgi:hypothetical protein
MQDEVLTMKQFHRKQRLRQKYAPVIEALKHKPYWDVAVEFGLGETTVFNIMMRERNENG